MTNGTMMCNSNIQQTIKICHGKNGNYFFPAQTIMIQDSDLVAFVFVSNFHWIQMTAISKVSYIMHCYGNIYKNKDFNNKKSK